MTVEEYLRFDEGSPIRHEYVAGEVYAISGVTLRHNRISLNIAMHLQSPAGDGACDVFATDVRLRAAEDIYYYPDVMVVCGPTSELDVIVSDPCVVVEVTSSSTARIDRGEKLSAYRAIPSLLAYFIVDHRRRRVERHWRAAAGAEWMRDEVVGDARVPVPCLDAELPLDAIYRRVDLATIAEPDVAEYETAARHPADGERHELQNGATPEERRAERRSARTTQSPDGAEPEPRNARAAQGRRTER